MTRPRSAKPRAESVARKKAARLQAVSGSVQPSFAGALVNRTMATLWQPASMDAARREQERDAAFVALTAFKPQDEIEGMLAAQAVGLHAASMECLRRAMIPDQPAELQAQLRKNGASLARAFTDILDALERKRGRSSQQIRVEHVHVHAGGKAIVGHIGPGAAGAGGPEPQSQGRPHETPARLAHDVALGAVFPPVWREKPGGEPVPVAGDARESPLPAARRRQHGAENA